VAWAIDLSNITKASFRVGTDGNHDAPVAPNLLQRGARLPERASPTRHRVLDIQPSTFSREDQ